MHVFLHFGTFGLVVLQLIYSPHNHVLFGGNLWRPCSTTNYYPAAGGGSEAGPVWGEVQELIPGTLEGSEPPQPGVLGRDVVSAGVHHKLNCNSKLQTNFDCDHFTTALHYTEPRLQNQLSK